MSERTTSPDYNPAIYPLRVHYDRASGAVAPDYPAECEPHTPQPRLMLQWMSWSEYHDGFMDQRQCRGCGLWQIWERRAITA